MTESASDKASKELNVSDLINSQEMSGGQLYKVVYLKGKAVWLKLEANMAPYDNRRRYYRWKDIIVD